MKAGLTILLVALGLGGIFVLRPPVVLPLREVIVTSHPLRVSEQDLLRLADVRQGENLLKISLTEVRQKILRYPWISDVRIARTLPGRLQLSVIEEVPVALLDLGTGLADLYLVNEEGEIFKKVTPPDAKDLPLLTGLTREQFEASEGSEKIQELLGILFKAQEMPVFEKIGVSEIHRGREGITLFTVDPVMKIFLGAGEWERRLRQFNHASGPILDAVGRAAGKVISVDLTYNRKIFVKRRG